MFTFALPAGLGVAELAGSFLTLVLWLVVLGLSIAWRYTIGAFLEYLANAFDKVSVVHVRPLHPVAEQLRALDYAITKGFDAVIVGAEHATVWLFRHGLRLIVWTVTEIWALSRDTFRALEHFDKVWLPRAIHHALRATGAFAVAIAHEVARGNRALWHDVTTLAHRLTQALAHRLHVVENAIAHTLPRVGHVERDLSRLRTRVRNLEAKAAPLAVAAIVAAALSRLGLKWLRCGNVENVGNRLCGMNPNLLESLLADALLIGGAISLVALAEEMQTVVGDSAGLIQRFWDAA